jgi:hypothetical protein
LICSSDWGWCARFAPAPVFWSRRFDWPERRRVRSAKRRAAIKHNRRRWRRPVRARSGARNKRAGSAPISRVANQEHAWRPRPAGRAPFVAGPAGARVAPLGKWPRDREQDSWEANQIENLSIKSTLLCRPAGTLVRPLVARRCPQVESSRGGCHADRRRRPKSTQ